MKKYFIISLFFISLFGASKAFSSALSKFQIQSTYLVSGKLNVPNSSVITTFKVDFDITRQYINVNNQNQPEKVDWTVTVMYSASSSPGASDNVAISDPFRVTESDFSTNNPLVYSKTGLEAKLPANKTSGLIFLKYSYYLWSQGVKSTNPVTSNSTTTYSISATATNPTNPTNPNPPTDITKMQNMGFSTIGMQTFSTYYVVEGDIRITKALLAVTNPYYGVNNTYDHNINIKVDASVWSSSNWYNGILEAARVWNTANTDIKINLIYDSFTYSIAPRVDVVVKGASLPVSPTKIPFEAEWVKGNGNPGGEIIVNTNPGYTLAPSGDDILHLFHAIAHTMALGHTSSTVPNHENSIMSRAFEVTSAWSYLVGNYGLPFANDVTYFNSRYPVNANSVINSYINGPATFSSSASVTFRSSYISAEAGITYAWKAVGINGTTYNYQESGSNPALYDFGLPAGNYRLECTISGGKYTTEVTATKNIVVN
ncbi:hypothetical protein LJ707_11550 [Mucilaginibacter sp. UR6-1]|uniref:hypothetical protein n=1 Tax=Mucilaginibacter sp. UR6-1 TaxID=1435643 RepID=UPI001E3B8A6E|nr:hypothetical protein [Mucilaginibacter sp. UR6-1]MCC8409569.1 hypothetical protein [Mucilaginibacter sp. UR6-1]